MSLCSCQRKTVARLEAELSSSDPANSPHLEDETVELLLEVQSAPDLASADRVAKAVSDLQRAKRRSTIGFHVAATAAGGAHTAAEDYKDDVDKENVCPTNLVDRAIQVLSSLSRDPLLTEGPKDLSNQIKHLHENLAAEAGIEALCSAQSDAILPHDDQSSTLPRFSLTQIADLQLLVPPETIARLHPKVQREILHSKKQLEVAAAASAPQSAARNSVDILDRSASLLQKTASRLAKKSADPGLKEKKKRRKRKGGHLKIKRKRRSSFFLRKLNFLSAALLTDLLLQKSIHEIQGYLKYINNWFGICCTLNRRALSLTHKDFWTCMHEVSQPVARV